MADLQNVYLVRSSTPSWYQVTPVAVDWWVAEAATPVWVNVRVEEVPPDLVVEFGPEVEDKIPKPRPGEAVRTGDHLRVVLDTGRAFTLNGVPIGPNGGLRF